MFTSRRLDEPGWLESYKSAHGALLSSEQEFLRWLENDYVPIAGGWQY
jgi:hypothetical protein